MTLRRARAAAGPVPELAPGPTYSPICAGHTPHDKPWIRRARRPQNVEPTREPVQSPDCSAPPRCGPHRHTILTGLVPRRRLVAPPLSARGDPRKFARQECESRRRLSPSGVTRIRENFRRISSDPITPVGTVAGHPDPASGDPRERAERTSVPLGNPPRRAKARGLTGNSGGDNEDDDDNDNDNKVFANSHRRVFTASAYPSTPADAAGPAAIWLRVR